MKKEQLKSKGITLIALVITIIVLLILAGVTIAALSGDNGILQNAGKAKEETEKAEAKEKVQLEVMNSYDEAGQFDMDKFKENLKNNLGLQDEDIKDNGDGSITVTVDGYEITVDSNGNVTLEGESTTGKIDGSYDTAKGVNTPKLKDNMKLVVYDNGNWIEDTTKSAYSYQEQAGATDTYNEETGEYGTSHWANAELDGNYYVWIPRYAYKITYNNPDDKTQGGTIDIKFLIGTSNKYYDENGEEKEAEIATDADEISTTGKYYVHPAFTFGETSLEGLWIGKYESSDAGNEEIAIIPNATSLRDINISTMFSRTQGLSTTNIDAHILKNTEWGAVAYLTQSQYGRNGTEVSVNQCSSYITGAGKTEGTNKIYEETEYSATPETIKGTDQAYDGEIGKMSSTTGNVYGIYDLSGGTYEYVMGVYGITGNPTIGSSGFTKFPDSKYYDLYTTTSENTTNIGDALYETSGWNSDNARFVDSYYPFFARGGDCDNGANAGVFSFYYDNGYGNSYNSFRVCLAVQ